MLEQDYIMRMIKEIIRAVLNLLFHIDTESPVTELLESQQSQTLLEELLKMVDAGLINEAENQVTDLLESENDDRLKIALLFYSHLNDKTNELQKCCWRIDN